MSVELTGWRSPGAPRRPRICPALVEGAEPTKFTLIMSFGGEQLKCQKNFLKLSIQSTPIDLRQAGVPISVRAAASLKHGPERFVGASDRTSRGAIPYRGG